MATIGRPKVALMVTDSERRELVRLTKRAHVNRALAFRARLVLACRDDVPNTAVARRYRTSNATVGKWRTRFVERRLDTMLMRGPQLDTFETSAFEHANNGFHVEIFQRIVSDRAQMKARTGAWGREGSLCQGSGASGSRGT